MEQRVVCQRCSYFFVTWEPQKPYGCKAYNFKSKAIPSSVVKQSSGISCSFYNPKQSK